MAAATQILITGPSPNNGLINEASGPIMFQPDGKIVPVVRPAGGNVLNFHDGSLQEGHTYSYRVLATGADNRTELSDRLTFTTPLSPSGFVTAFNAAAAIGGGGGMTLYGFFVPVTGYQTINGVTTGSNIAGGQSPTGFLKAAWLNVVSPASGSDFVPTVARPFGAPCTVQGYMRDAGLFISSTSAALISSLGTADPNDIASTQNWPHSLFTDRTRGMTFFGVAKMVASIGVYQLGENAGADTLSFTGDIFSGYESLRDPAAGHWPGAQNVSNGGSLPVTFDVTYVKTGLTSTNNGFAMRMRLGRDLILDQRPASVNPNILATGRNLYLLLNGAASINPALDATELRCFGFGSGRMNLAQTILWNDYAEAQLWTPGALWKDNRIYAPVAGDSFVQPWDITDSYDPAGVSHTGHINRGSDGAAALGNTCLTNNARSGNDIRVWQGPITLRWHEDCDFKNRSLIEALISEWINGSTFEQNYSLVDLFRALAPDKIKIAMYDLFYGNLGEKNAAIPASYTRLNGEALSQGHADIIVHLTNTSPFDLWAWGNGLDIGTDPVNGQQPEYWGGQHPTDLTIKTWEQPVRLGFRRMRGDNVAGITQRIKASVEFTNLDASIVQTFTPVWSCFDYLDTPVANSGVTWESRNVSVVTVDPVTGQLTGRGTGRTVVLARKEGAVGTMIVIGTGTAPIPTPSYTGIWDFSATANLYQDSGRTTLVTADGQPIGNVTDMTGNGSHASQATAGRRGIWKANIKNGLGAALLTAASHQHWLLPQGISPNGPLVIFAAVNADAALAAQKMIIGRSFGTDEFDFLISATHKFFGALNLSGGSKGTTSTVAGDGSWVILEMVYDGASITIRINGADMHTIAASGTVVYPTGNDIFAIGAQVLSVDTPASDYQGYIGEIRYIRDQLIGASDLSTFRHNIAAKWGITVS